MFNVKGNKRKGKWTRHDTRHLKNIIKYMPHLYVNEITERMQIVSGRFWSQSYMYKNLRKLGWSLQVIFERARQINLQERANYKYALHYYLKHPRQLITLDGTYRGKKNDNKTSMLVCYWTISLSGLFLWITWKEVFCIMPCKYKWIHSICL